ncbi:MAG: oligopeptide/dipeptide ABC transporter ATP-binding protein [Anaerolineaceae bacterium]
MEPKNKLVEVQNLKTHFPIRQGLFSRVTGTVKAVDGVSFVIRRGETFGVVGESGSGKTTVGRSILRAIRHTSGSCHFWLTEDKDVDIFSLEPAELRLFRRHMQMIFQDPYASLNPRMTVREIIAEPLVATRLVKNRSELEDRVVEVARRCRLNIDYLKRYPHAFSGGERQRIGIARSLVLHPEFIVCDEPVSALDVSIQAEILNLLYDLQSEFNLTYLFIAHDLSVVEHVSDQVAVMYLGRLVEIAATTELFNHPRHPYTEALLSAIPAADPDDPMRLVPLKGEIPSPLNPPSGCYFHPRCPYAREICQQSIPEWKELSPGHRVTCHLAKSLELTGVKKGKAED